MYDFVNTIVHLGGKNGVEDRVLPTTDAGNLSGGLAAFDGAVHKLGKQQYEERQKCDAEGEQLDGHGLGKLPENERRKRHARKKMPSKGR